MTVWITGANGTVKRTTDGGQTWQTVLQTPVGADGGDQPACARGRIAVSGDLSRQRGDGVNGGGRHRDDPVCRGGAARRMLARMAAELVI